MADLSDADKKILLGANYKQDAAARDAERGVTEESRRAKKLEALATDMIMGGIGVGLIALIIAVTNYNSIGTPYSPTLVTVCMLVVAASAATVIWFIRSRRMNR